MSTEAPALSKSRPAPARSAAAGAESLTRDDMRLLYRNMILSRRLDDAEIALRKQNKVFFQISGAGHEAWNAAVGFCLKPSYDWFYPYYRDRALMLQLGMTATEILLEGVGAEADPNSHGRQMPCHFGSKKLNVVSQSSPTGTQCNQSAGCAEATQIIKKLGLELPHHDDEITYISLGDGTTSEGEFHESLNTLCIRNLPVIVCVENNQYAISVPVEENIPGGDISRVCSGYPGLTTYNVDGTDVIASIELMREVVAKMRRRECGPVLIQAFVTRPYSHSLSDDHIYYRPKAELDDETARDPIMRFAHYLVDNGYFTEEEIAAIRTEAEVESKQATKEANDAARPHPDTAMDHLYCTVNSPLDDKLFSASPSPEDNNPIPMGQAINRCLMDELERDQRVLVFGQDCADATKEENLAECKGKGGVFKITYGLQRKFGYTRCFNGPLSEANIIGRAIGMATRGLRPVAEIQFFDYIWPAFHQLRNELATMRYRSGGDFTAPVVVRVPIGGYLRGGGIYHSQTGECIFVQCPGLRVVYPSNAADAVGLLRTAIRCDDPVMYFEHKHLYYQGYNRAPYPGPDFMIPFGKAAVRRTGTDLTIVTWGALVQKSLEAAEKLSKEDGYEAEVIDIRTLNPLDEETIFNSVRKTHRLVVASEESPTGGFSGEIASLVGENCFEWLDAPVKRVGSLHTWVAYSPILEERILPQTNDVLEAIREVARY